MFKKTLFFLLQHPWLGTGLAVTVAALGLTQGTSLPLRLSLSDLLPEDSESVRDLNAVSKEVGGEGYFIILVGPMDNPIQQVSKVAEIMQRSSDVQYAFFEREEFMLRDKYLFLMDRPEFDKAIGAMKTLFLNQKDGIFDIGLFDDEAAQAKKKQDAKDYLASLKNKVKSHGEGPGASQYFLSADGKMAMVLAKPKFDAGNLEKSTALVDFARKELAAGLPKEVPFRLVGRYVDKVNDTQQIQRDIAKTGVICFIAIFAFIFLGFGSFRVPFYSLGLVSLSMGWTLGIAQVAVGQINILTGFLLAILGGLGVEYGVHLFRRYYQERMSGLDHQRAFEDTYFVMGRTLGSSAVTSSLAFLILSFSDFRGFSELGIIAGSGILSVYCCFMLCFPLIGRWLRSEPRFGGGKEIFGYYPVTTRWLWGLPVFMALVIWGITRAEFEYNFKRLHNLSKETADANALVEHLFGKFTGPAAILATDKDQALGLQKFYQEPRMADQVHQVNSLHTLVPGDMESRLPEITRFKSLVKESSRKFIEKETGVPFDDVKKWFEARPYTRADLPVNLRDAFGLSGNVVVVYPKHDVDDAKRLREFAGVLLEGKKAYPGMRIGSEVTVFVQILDHVINDGRIVLMFFLLGAFLVLWLDFRSFADALDLELQLIAGIALLVGLMGLFDVRFSILNIAMVPAVLAAGIDMGIHVRHREKEGTTALGASKFISHAVHLSALTTVIGFASLFFAEAGILKGIAWISVLGQVSMYLVCMVIRPMVRDGIPALRRKQKNPPVVVPETSGNEFAQKS